MKRRSMAVCVIVLAIGLAWVQLEAANTFTLISGGSGNFGAFPQWISADGSRTYFITNEALVAGDTDPNATDVYRRANGVLSLISGGTSTNESNFAGELPDGSALFFTAESLVLADADTENDIYRNANGVVTLVTTGTAQGLGFERVYGSKVFFQTNEALSAGDTDTFLDVYVWSALDSSITLVTPGTPNGYAVVPDGLPNSQSDVVGSADGSVILIATDEAISIADTDLEQDVYRFEAGTGTLLTGGVQNMHAVFTGASADLSHVFFRTSEPLSDDDTDDKSDVYQAFNGGITLLSGSTDDSSVEFLDASVDGTRVILRASLLPLSTGGATFATDLYLSSAGAITLVSGVGNAPVLFGGISADGAKVFFSTEDVLAADDTDAFRDVYEWAGGVLTLKSPGSQPSCVFLGLCGAHFVATNSDGSKMIFLSFESLLAEDTDNLQRDVYMNAGGVLTLRSPDGATGGAQGGAIASAELDVVLLLTSDVLDPADLDASTFDLYASVVSGPAEEDTLAPTVTCDPADGQWHAGNVTLVCTASDAGSGLADVADENFNLSTSVAADVEDSNASTNSRQVCDVAGNCATAQVSGNKIDRRAPLVQLTTPVAAAVYTVGQVVLANYTCQDFGSGLQSCLGSAVSGSPIDTATVGTKTFGVIGTDAVGNVGTANAMYSVIPGGGGGGFAFGGFLSPIQPLPALNAMKAGAAIAVRFSLGGPQGLGIFAAGSPVSQPIVCATGVGAGSSALVFTPGNSTLKYDAATDLYSFNWKTDKSWAGTCRQLVLQFSDGSVQRANFTFK